MMDGGKDPGPDLKKLEDSLLRIFPFRYGNGIFWIL